MSAPTAVATAVRATTGEAALVARRRARRDAGLLTATAVLLLLTLVVALALPRIASSTADVAVRDAVRAAGAEADLVVRGLPPAATYGAPDHLSQAASDLRWLEARVGDVGPDVVTLETPGFVTGTPRGPVLARFVHAGRPDVDDADGGVRWTSGVAPQTRPEPAEDEEDAATSPPEPRVVEVGVAERTAAETGLAVGDEIVVTTATASGGARAVVTGLYTPVDPADPRWRTVPDALGPVRAPPAARAESSVALLVPEPAVRGLMAASAPAAVRASARTVVTTEGMSLADALALRDDLAPHVGQGGRVETALVDVLAATGARLAAARAQASVIVAGLGTVGALCLVLAAGLLVDRRRTHLVAERARGAGLAGVALRAALESVPTAVLALGVALAVVLPVGGTGAPGVALLVALVAAAAPPVLAVAAAARAWSPRRVPADRRERARHAALVAARRVVAELTVALLAAGAVVAVRQRGLVPAAGGEVDPLLAAAPVLLAAAAAVVVVRATPAAVGALRGVADRTRGLGATLALARAQGATTGVVAVLAGTVAVALVVLAGTVLHTVRVGQRDAAAALVVGDVRVDGTLPAGLADDLRARPGVTHVAQGAQLPGRSLGSRTGATATLLVVDAAELAAVRTAAGLPVDPDLAALADAGAGAGAVPALLSPDLADRLAGLPLRLGVLDGSVDLELRGTTTLTADPGAPATDGRAAPPDGGDDDGLVVVDRAALAAATTAPAADRLWAAGPGAGAAVTDTGVDAQEGVDVTTRDGWWRAWSGSALTAGLTSLLGAGTALLLLDLVLVLVLVAVASAPARGRTLSALRTLGLDARTAAWATAGELAPLAAGALVGGTLIGLALPLLVGDALGLTLLTGEPQTAAVRWTVWPVALAAAATLAALAVAVVAEQAVRRRDRLGEVLRVGER